MKLYYLRRTQILPLSLQEAWNFFSIPQNLEKITPPDMTVEVIYSSDQTKTYAGQIIQHRVKVLAGTSIHWVTEITHVNEPYLFVDEQRFGPFRFWHHQHHFREIPEGVEMTDELHYAIPLGFIGRIANMLFVAQKLSAIFDYRFKTLELLFSNTKNKS